MNGGWVPPTTRSVGRGPWTSRSRIARNKISFAPKVAVGVNLKTGTNPTIRTGYGEEMQNGANRSTRCCKASSCHDDKGSRMEISHSEPSFRKLRGTALERLASMSKAPGNMGADEGGLRSWTGGGLISFADCDAVQTSIWSINPVVFRPASVTSDL